MENKVKITVDGKELEIDLKRAKELGICEEVRQKITSFKIGDVYENRNCTRVVIIECFHRGDQRFNIGGWCGFMTYSDLGIHAQNEEEILAYLNDKNRDFKFIANINDKVASLIANAQSEE